MFCSYCSSPIAADATFCTSCGKSANAQPSPADRAIAHARTAAEDAKLAIRSLLSDPLALIGETYRSLGEVKARSAAIGLLTFFAVVDAFAAYRNMPRGLFGFYNQNEFKLLIASVIVGAAIAVVAVLGRMFARMTFQGKGDFTSDLFVTSVCLLAFAAPLFLFGLFTLDSQVAGIVVWGSFVVASPFSLLIQYEGNLQILNLGKNKAAWMISLTLVYALVLMAPLVALIAQILK
jgi:hypothetical protein